MSKGNYSKVQHDILNTEYSKEFDTYRQNRMIMGFMEYGPIKENYEQGLIDAQKSCEECIRLYKETGNKKYLIDLANFAMIEFMHPKHPDSHGDYGDTVISATQKISSVRELESYGKDVDALLEEVLI